MGWFTDMPNHLPLATGPFVPGMVDVMFNYQKELPFVRLYYPTQEKCTLKEQAKKWVSWIPHDSYFEAIAKVLMLYKFVLKLVFWWSDDIKIPALYGTKAKTDNLLRVVVLSHGLGGTRFLYTNICCELASRGFLVVALEHRDHSACTTYYYKNKSDAEQDIRTYIPFKHIKFGDGHHHQRNEQLKIKYNECSTVLQFLKQLQGGSVPINVIDEVPVHRNQDIHFNLKDLVGKIDLDSITMMGHSFGAATALYTLSREHDFKQGILLDPWMFPIKNENLSEKINQPLLFINTQTFHIAANVKAMSSFLNRNGTKMYTLKHTTHESQTDSVLLIGYWLNWFMKKLDPLLALTINNALILSFLNKNINFPSNISDCNMLLAKEEDNIEEGLTNPWA